MRTKSPAIPPVIKTIRVPCTPAEAFRYFTADLDKWWPLATHSCIASVTKGTDKPVSCMIEPRAGGRVFETARNGEEHEWGTVLVWEPPVRLAFTWRPGRQKITAQTVEVIFSQEDDSTVVVLTHTGWENLGDQGPAQRDNYHGGWDIVFAEAFGKYVQQHPS
jgi:uncharacterized protein YndB with AHSA1/START domain